MDIHNVKKSGFVLADDVSHVRYFYNFYFYVNFYMKKKQKRIRGNNYEVYSLLIPLLQGISFSYYIIIEQDVLA